MKFKAAHLGLVVILASQPGCYISGYCTNKAECQKWENDSPPQTGVTPVDAGGDCSAAGALVATWSRTVGTAVETLKFKKDCSFEASSCGGIRGKYTVPKAKSAVVEAANDAAGDDTAEAAKRVTEAAGVYTYSINVSQGRSGGSKDDITCPQAVALSCSYTFSNASDTTEVSMLGCKAANTDESYFFKKYQRQ